MKNLSDMKERNEYSTVHQTQSGHFIFNKMQSQARLRLCKDALRGIRCWLRFKDIYRSQEEAAKYAIQTFIGPETFDAHLQEIECELGWNGKSNSYENAGLAEGGFYPFARCKGSHGANLIDMGCIWIGNRHCYPRIYVDNELAWWDEPYDLNGELAQFPFLPYSELHSKMHKLRNAKFRSRYKLELVDRYGVPMVY